MYTGYGFQELKRGTRFQEVRSVLPLRGWLGVARGKHYRGQFSFYVNRLLTRSAGGSLTRSIV